MMNNDALVKKTRHAKQFLGLIDGYRGSDLFKVLPGKVAYQGLRKAAKQGFVGRFATIIGKGEYIENCGN